MKRILVLAALLSPAASFASPIDGTWAFPVGRVNGFVYAGKMTLTDSVSVVENNCSFGGKSARVSVSAPIMITETQIVTLGASEQKVNENGVDCYASIEKGTVGYKLVSPDVLMLTAGGQSVNLNRVK